jgi:D-sorbitol dehydrogenase-like protein
MKRRFPMWPLTRRATLRISLSAAMSSLLPGWKARAQTPVPDDLHARFLGWSRTATGLADLPPDAARAYMELVLRSGVSPQALSHLAPDAYGGTPIEKQLLAAWYSGVFKLDGSAGVRSYATTLMWRAAGIDPPPSTCDGGPERWASAPSKI